MMTIQEMFSDKCYIPLVEINYFNALTDNKPFFDKPVKNKRDTYEKLVKISQNKEYTTGNLLDYLHHQKYYKLIRTDIINFTGKIKDYDGATMFFNSKSSKKLFKIFLSIY